ncbi:protein FATTY ACID EXPORT 4, chloroplastic [Oryza brachyantha]|uniref:Uncharacterized protein n=1 Tax=Oryza brachyantha TaxID=4533 RepID=J3M0M7_ORYBR|nr:protein FATTY ACID EXPORT 4, chloroplastic [Oryza brachyantha]
MTAAVAITSSLLFRPPVAVRSLPSPPRPHDVPCPRSSRRRPALLCCSAVSELAPAASAAYGALLLGGGAFAYVRSGSKGSIFGGLSGSALMGISYYLMQSPDTKAIGDAVGFGSAFLFASVFGIRLYNTRKLVPSGLLLVLSLGALVVFYSAYLQDKV